MIETRDQLYQTIGGYRVTQIVRAAALLGICDVLSSGPRGAPDVAAEVGVDPGVLRRLMRGLAGVGVLNEGEDGRFSNTEIGALLRADEPGSMRNVAIGLSDDPWWRAWAELHRGIKAGAIPFEVAHGRTFWEVAGAATEVATRFNGFMAAQTEAFVPQLLGAFDFAGSTRVVDVGGGIGALVAGILVAHPGTRGTVFDRSEGLDKADTYLRERGVRDRCDLVAGDFFGSVPSGGDAYLLRLILHDWEDEQAAQILTACRHAMRPGARLLVIDHLLPHRAVNGTQERNALMIDLHMLVLFGARERTEDELRLLLRESGFEVERVAPTSPTATIVAVAV